MDRRRFLSMLAIGAPAALVAAKIGLLDRLKTLFAPRRREGIYVEDWFSPAEKWLRSHGWTIEPVTGLMSLGGQSAFNYYGDGGELSEGFVRYYLHKPNLVFEHYFRHGEQKIISIRRLQ